MELEEVGDLLYLLTKINDNALSSFQLLQQECIHIHVGM